MKFFVLSGSTRAASVNSRLAHEIGGRLTALGHDVSVHSMADFELPIYSGDLEKETGAPESAQSFRAALESADGLIVVSPEYNFSFPGGLKNLIDWVSRFRPYPFKNVPTFLASASPSPLGGNRGLWALRIPLECLGAYVHPEMFSLARTNETFPDRFADEKLSERLDATIAAFANYTKALV